MKRLLVVVMLGTLVGCGGDSSPTSPPTPLPTPVPVTYNGTYTGTQMTYTAGGQFLVSANTTISQTGANLSFSSLHVLTPIDVNYGIGSAVLTTNTFDGTNQYTSAGCGTATNHYRGYFSGDGNIMNMTMTLTFSDRSCDEVDIRGEMRR